MELYRLEPDQLNKRCALDQFDFETTEEITPSLKMVGQKRAIDAIDFGLTVKEQGYNIFSVNLFGRRELEFIVSAIKDRAEEMKIPNDLCYVHNFSNSDRPISIQLPAGLGREFKEEMEEFIEKIKLELAKLFDSNNYNRKKNKLKSKYQNKNSKLLNQLESRVEELDYTLEREKKGFSIIPLLENGDLMSEEEYEDLPYDIKEEMDQSTKEIQDMIDKTFAKIDKLNHDYEEELKSLESRLVLEILIKRLEPLYEKYYDLNQIIRYLNGVKNEIICNLDDFKEDGSDNNTLLLLGTEGKKEDRFNKYKVNLVVDNSKLEGAPVIVEKNPTYYNLIGKIEYKNKEGNLITGFNQIKAGALQRANGGYLILEAREVLSNFKSWQLLKRVLKSEELRIENLGQEYDKIPLATLKPEVIPINLKIIMVGSMKLYRLLYRYDSDFRDLFKIKAQFESTTVRNYYNNLQLIKFISWECKRNNLHPLSKQAVGRIIEYSSRQVGNQKRLSTQFSSISDLLCEADICTTSANKEVISEVEIEEVIKKRRYYRSGYEEKLQQLYEDEKLKIQTEGRRIGEINALSVLDIEDYSFGRPIKISAVVYKGNKGVVNIEREVQMSGKIHNKGVLILTGYLGNKYGQRDLLSVSASLCFEQLYGEVDGDSASSAELYALLSALSKVPIKQSLAVTGSINQKGEVQPVGGVIEKIEGFFRLCKKRGLTGEEGVIIPAQNVEDLMLADEVIEAVEEGEFNVYAINNVNEGIELLMDKEAGERRADGTYPEGTINYYVQRRINGWAGKNSDE